eukprot:COSAG02_NODE_138_length_34440_cov_16.694368_5_plen_88_part_00
MCHCWSRYDSLPSGKQAIAIDILERLLERGLDVLGVDSQGVDMLQMAAASHNIEALKCLFAKLESGMVYLVQYVLQKLEFNRSISCS